MIFNIWIFLIIFANLKKCIINIRCNGNRMSYIRVLVIALNWKYLIISNSDRQILLSLLLEIAF